MQSETLPRHFGSLLRHFRDTSEVIRGHPKPSEGFKGTLTAFWERKEGWSVPSVRRRATDEIK